METITALVQRWERKELSTVDAKDKILSVLACSSFSMGTIMKIVSELPKGLLS